MDFDGDGRKDILSGSWPGDIYLFRKQADGSFAPGEILKDKEDRPIRARRASDRRGAENASVAFAADWNGDGAIDLIVGNIEGQVFLVPNEGTTRKPAFGTPVVLEAATERPVAMWQPIRVPHGDAGPIVADWDGDGIPDLIVGAGDGSVLWYRNAGTAKAPRLAEAVALVKSDEKGFQLGGLKVKVPDREKAPGPPAHAGMRAKVCVADWNGDGRPDLIVGDFASGPAESKNLTDEQKAERDRLRKEYADVVQEYVKLLPQETEETSASPTGAKAASTTESNKAAAADRAEKLKKVQARLAELSQKRAGLEEMPTYHGWVWVYLRQEKTKAGAKGS